MTCSVQGTDGCVYLGSSWTALARVYRQIDGTLIVTADLSRIERTIYDLGNPDAPSDQRDLTISEVFYDTLQMDDRWTVDDIGYNFADTVPPELLVGQFNRIIYTFHMLDGSSLTIKPWQVQVINPAPQL